MYPIYPVALLQGDTLEETEQNIHEAVQMHIQGLREDHLPIPDSQSFGEYILVE